MAVRAAKRRREKFEEMSSSCLASLRVGDVVLLSGLQSNVDLNGQQAKVEVPPNDDDQVVVSTPGVGHFLRVAACKLSRLTPSQHGREAELPPRHPRLLG